MAKLWKKRFKKRGLHRKTVLEPHDYFSASRLLSSLNTKVEPCDNFYEFACGTWAKKTVIPEDVSSYTMFSVVREDVEVIMKSRSRRIKKETVLDASKVRGDVSILFNYIGQKLHCKAGSGFFYSFFLNIYTDVTICHFEVNN